MDRSKEISGLRAVWENLDADYLDTYLVRGPQDPRINLASVLTRHELVRLIDYMNPGRGIDVSFKSLRARELIFAKALTSRWLRVKDKRSLPYRCARKLRRMLFPTHEMPGAGVIRDQWQKFCVSCGAHELYKPSVLECACGSANDYRFMDSYGLAGLINYTGIDITEKNIGNASKAFPNARFAVGDVTQLPYEDSHFDCTIVFDLFEHFSIELMEIAFDEIIRVTKTELILTFFNMADIPSHIVNPVKTYHWNTLSRRRISESLQARSKVTGIEMQSMYSIHPVDFTFEKGENENNWVWIIYLKS